MNTHKLTFILLCTFFIFGCNPFPRTDAHPEVPLLEDLLKDKSKFKKIVGMENLTEIIFLKDDRILLKPDNSNLPFKIINPENNVILADKYDWNLPFYIDKQGELYFNRKKYFYPDYKKQEGFKNIVVQDSLSKISEENNDLNDSIGLKIWQDYEVKLLKPYGLVPCGNTIVNTDQCDFFEVRNNTLVVRQDERFKIDFVKQKNDIPKFDDNVLIAWHNGKMPNPIYLAYYQINTIKFKCDDMTYPQTVVIADKTYLYSASVGLYQIL
ncbi:hypothetical protein EZJ43_07960 [Pedobacter changchengzhani]|uniref:Lipoprotein n=1 Tax=Pedobacter changchengzhani TaxID=2529274 RepID=A0A4R5ML76_9SPHI|nr:hypothetical protein [Pedobacter changchengzhani]TDG36444.1 hypothetical protein EZJ43_07960 [Pedobacter changchengzhani]